MLGISCHSVASRVQFFCDPIDCSPPGSTVHEISQGRILEWAALSCSRLTPSPGIKPKPPALAGAFSPVSPQGSLARCKELLIKQHPCVVSQGVHQSEKHTALCCFRPLTLLVWFLSELRSRCSCSGSKCCPTLRPHGPQHARLPCPPPSTRVCANSCPLSG